MNLEWHHPASQWKKFNATPSAGKVMATVFFGCRRHDSDRHHTTCKPLSQICKFKLFETCRSISGEFDLTKLLLKSSHNTRQHNHTQILKHGKQSKVCWTLLLHPPYSPDLAPSDFHLFRALKDAIHGKRFGSDDKVTEVAVCINFKLAEKGDTCCCFMLAQGR
jgi:histone-lysine N-methyltransferase SETMAR